MSGAEILRVLHLGQLYIAYCQYLHSVSFVLTSLAYIAQAVIQSTASDLPLPRRSAMITSAMMLTAISFGVSAPSSSPIGA